MEYLQLIGFKIRNLRQSLRMTQEELAIKSRYTSRSSMNKIEKGLVDLPRSKIVEIATALNTTPAYLMGWEEEKEIAPTEPELSEDELELLQLIRLMPAEMKAMYKEALRAALKSQGLI